MSIQVTLPDDLADQIDHVANDRGQFVVEAVRRLLRDSVRGYGSGELERINELAEELNREADDVLEYQTLS
jgi:metal-responsive CopG/Arc/MetJ family transcriptional regulator